MNRIILSLFLITFFSPAFAQQDPMYTHYMYNTLSVNPAYAGSREALTATLLHRTQWMNFPGAPNTQSLTLHSPIVAGVNLGLDVMNDRIGPVNSTSFNGSYAYRFNLTANSELSLGLSTGLKFMSVNYNNFTVIDPNDPAFANAGTRTDLNIGFGAYYSTKRFYAGFSTPGLFQKAYSATISYDASELNERQRHYYFISGAMIPINAEWDVKPTGLLKVTEGAPVQLDLSAQMVYLNKFDFGVMFRSDLNVARVLRQGDGIGLLLGVELFDHIYMGYSYDYSFANPTQYANSGSHELMIRYDLIVKDKHRIKSPRYF